MNCNINLRDLKRLLKRSSSSPSSHPIPPYSVFTPSSSRLRWVTMRHPSQASLISKGTPNGMHGMKSKVRRTSIITSMLLNLYRTKQGGGKGQVRGTRQGTPSRDHQVKGRNLVCLFTHSLDNKMLLSFVQKRFNMFKYNAALAKRKTPANALPRIQPGILLQNISTPPSILTLSRQSPAEIRAAVGSMSGFRLRVTRHRSLIGMHKRKDWERTSRSLRLFKTHQTSYWRITRSVLGNVMKLRRLVKVRLVRGEPQPGQKYWAKGYRVVGSALQDSCK